MLRIEWVLAQSSRIAKVIVFSLPPLKFRTAGFPQYGFKREVGDDLRWTCQLIRRPSRVASPCGACAHVQRGSLADAPVQRPLARQAVMLSARVVAYYGLIRATRLPPTAYLLRPSEPSMTSGSPI